MGSVIKENIIYTVVKFESMYYGRSPVSILYKSIAGRYQPVSVADGPITARHRFIQNASWEYDTNTSCGEKKTI